jgi:Uma2 family endonuclease
MNEALKLEENYTYADYAEWDVKDENGNPVRYELIDGRAYAMAAPSTKHQDILGELFALLRNFLRGRRCRAFVAPFDVQLSGQGDFDRNVVQPDITVICDDTKITDKGCNGAPDMVAEILSPSSSKHDRTTKFRKYQNAGVREYWMIDINEGFVDVAVFRADKKYTIARYMKNDVIESTVLAGFSVSVEELCH